MHFANWLNLSHLGRTLPSACAACRAVALAAAVAAASPLASACSSSDAVGSTPGVCEGTGGCAADGGTGGSSAIGGSAGGGGTMLADGSPGGAAGQVSSGDGCVEDTVTWESEIPTVVLLIDRSGSMLIPFGGQGTRWSAIRDALIDSGSGVVTKLEHDVRFGLSLYTSLKGTQGGTCPKLEQVSPLIDNYLAIKAVYEPATPLDDTPTGESLAAVANAMAPLMDPGRKIIVLATDGNPDTCADPQNQTQAAKDLSVQAAQDAYAQGVETFIISVANGVALDHLKDMANAGAGLPVSGNQQAPYYEAGDPKALVDAFNTIINGARSCVLKLNGWVDPADAGLGKVVLDGKTLGYGDAEGWKMNSPTEIELVGSACDAIQQGDHAVGISFPCGVVQPPK